MANHIIFGGKMTFAPTGANVLLFSELKEVNISSEPQILRIGLLKLFLNRFSYLFIECFTAKKVHYRNKGFAVESHDDETKK